MICRAGRTPAALSAMSAARNTSLPGAISMYSSAMPASGTSPGLVAAMCAAHCGCMRSMNAYVRSGARPLALARLGLLRPDAEGAGQDQVKVVAAAGPVVQRDQLTAAVFFNDGATP